MLVPESGGHFGMPSRWLLRGYGVSSPQVHILAVQKLSSTYTTGRGSTPTTYERLVGCYYILLGDIYTFQLLSIHLAERSSLVPADISTATCGVPSDAHAPSITDSNRAKSFWFCAAARSLKQIVLNSFM
jgi:hypothetical protein